jgi:hypothetical protein
MSAFWSFCCPVVAALFLASCAPSEGGSLSTERRLANPLIGKWELQKRKYAPDTSFVATPDSLGYVKIITEQSFVWYQYNKNTRNLVMLGGGTYELEGESYLEHIEYYHPPGTYMEGSDIPFKCTVQGDEWHHSGYISEREYDAEIGDYVVLQERRLEEIWRKVE